MTLIIAEFHFRDLDETTHPFSSDPNAPGIVCLSVEEEVPVLSDPAVITGYTSERLCTRYEHSLSVSDTVQVNCSLPICVNAGHRQRTKANSAPEKSDLSHLVYRTKARDAIPHSPYACSSFAWSYSSPCTEDIDGAA